MVKPVSEESHVRLTKWGVMQDYFGYRLVGVPEGSRSGRVTSPIVAWNGHAMVAETESGRQYHLIGDEDRETAAQIIRAHAARWGVPGDQVAMALPEELDEFLGPKPGTGVH
jgi:hypothetical protein